MRRSIAYQEREYGRHSQNALDKMVKYIYSAYNLHMLSLGATWSDPLRFSSLGVGGLVSPDTLVLAIPSPPSASRGGAASTLRSLAELLFSFQLQSRPSDCRHIKHIPHNEAE